MKDRALLSAWIDQHKSDTPSEKQTAFAKSISDRKKIEIQSKALRSKKDTRHKETCGETICLPLALVIRDKSGTGFVMFNFLRVPMQEVMA